MIYPIPKEVQAWETQKQFSQHRAFLFSLNAKEVEPCIYQDERGFKYITHFFLETGQCKKCGEKIK